MQEENRERDNRRARLQRIITKDLWEPWFSPLSPPLPVKDPRKIAQSKEDIESYKKATQAKSSAKKRKGFSFNV